MKKDFSQLGIIPSVVWGMLGYSSGIGLLRSLSDFFNMPLQISSVNALDLYRITIAILFALVPWIVLLVGVRRYGTKQAQPLSWYGAGTALLLGAIVFGLVLEMFAMNNFQKEVQNLVPGEQWVFSVEELHPFRSGAGGLLIASAMLFLVGMWRKQKE